MMPEAGTVVVWHLDPTFLVAFCYAWGLTVRLALRRLGLR